jgi:hypothetical protein
MRGFWMKKVFCSVGLATFFFAQIGYSQDLAAGRDDEVETITVVGEKPGAGAGWSTPGAIIGGSGAGGGSGGSSVSGGGSGGIAQATAPKKTEPEQEKKNEEAKKKMVDKSITDKSLISEFLTKAREAWAAFGSRNIYGKVRLKELPDGTKVYEACGAFQAGQAANSGKDYCVDNRIEEFQMPDGTKMIRFQYTPIKTPCAQYDARMNAIFWACTPEGAFEFYATSIDEIEQGLFQ